MASIPVTAYSATKVHEHVRQHYKHGGKAREDPKAYNSFHNSAFDVWKSLVPPNYNSKMMNSIWGMYNLYAAHAFQKNNEGSYLEASLPGPQAKSLSLWESIRPRC